MTLMMGYFDSTYNVNTVLVFPTITGIKFPTDAVTSITLLDKSQPFSFPSNDTNLL